MSQLDTENEEFLFKSLDRDQVDYALELLEELHPIEHTPICVAYPAIGYLCCCLPAYPRPRNKVSLGLENDPEEPLLQKKKTLKINGKEKAKKK